MSGLRLVLVNGRDVSPRFPASMCLLRLLVSGRASTVWWAARLTEIFPSSSCFRQKSGDDTKRLISERQVCCRHLCVLLVFFCGAAVASPVSGPDRLTPYYWNHPELSRCGEVAVHVYRRLDTCKLLLTFFLLGRLAGHARVEVRYAPVFALVLRDMESPLLL